MNKKARVFVTIKPDVLDPAGVLVKRVLNRQGLLDVSEVRIGKMIDITLQEGKNNYDQKEVFGTLKKIFCNPIVEDCVITMVDEHE